jgi:hypothetical protein
MVFVGATTKRAVHGRGAFFDSSRPRRPLIRLDHGGVHFLALDSGEGKPDDNKEYAGQVEFASFASTNRMAPGELKAKPPGTPGTDCPVPSAARSGCCDGFGCQNRRFVAAVDNADNARLC